MALLSSDADSGENAEVIFIPSSFDMESHIVRENESAKARPNPEPCLPSNREIVDCETPSNMSCLLAFESTQAARQSCWLNDTAFRNM